VYRYETLKNEYKDCISMQMICRFICLGIGIRKDLNEMISALNEDLAAISRTPVSRRQFGCGHDAAQFVLGYEGNSMV
jgi:hypothetical protein